MVEKLGVEIDSVSIRVLNTEANHVKENIKNL